MAWATGVFTDHTGDYLPGMYIRHPMQWAHAPYVDATNADAVVWVKVSQVVNPNDGIIVCDTNDMSLPDWKMESLPDGAIKTLALYPEMDPNLKGKAETTEKVWVELWKAGTAKDIVQPEGGEELFILEGELVENGVTYGPESWIRNPVAGAGTVWKRSSPKGCKLMMKSGHLPVIQGLFDKCTSGTLAVSSEASQYKDGPAGGERVHGLKHMLDMKRREQGMWVGDGKNPGPRPLELDWK